MRSLGISPRRFLGWEPERHKEKRGGRVIITVDPEWDEIDRGLMRALVEVEADICPGCGGFLSVTTVHDHGYRITPKQCLQCESVARWEHTQSTIDELMKDTNAATWPQGRRLFTKPIPLPEPDSDEV